MITQSCSRTGGDGDHDGDDGDDGDDGGGGDNSQPMSHDLYP